MSMVFGELSRECRLNFTEIASAHVEADIHPIGMQSFEPAETSPDLKDRRVFQEGHQQVLVIACQCGDWGRPFAACKLLDHALGAKTAVDIIAQENRHGMIN